MSNPENLPNSDAYFEEWKIKNPGRGTPKSQIIDFLIHKIQTKAYMPGEKLPVYRKLAEEFEISQRTAQSIYQTLIDKNYIFSLVGSGYYVAEHLPIDGQAGLPAEKKFPGKLYFPERVMPSRLIGKIPPFAQLFMDPVCFPAKGYFSRIGLHNQRTFKTNDAIVDTHYSEEEFKTTMLHHLTANRGFDICTGQLHIIRDRVIALRHIFKAISKRGDRIMTTVQQDENLDEVCLDIGLEVSVIRQNSEDFISLLEEEFDQHHYKILYIRSQCSFPDGKALKEEDCRRLLTLCNQHQVIIMEEDDYHEFWHTKKPVPLVCYSQSYGGIIYIGGVSKLRPYLNNLRTIVGANRFISVLQTFPAAPYENRSIDKEIVLSEMLLNGDYVKQITKARKRANKCRSQTDTMLTAYLSPYIKYQLPNNGFTFWLEFPDAIDLRQIIRELQSLEGSPDPNPWQCPQDEPVHHLQLNFLNADIHELEWIVKNMETIISQYL